MIISTENNFSLTIPVGGLKEEAVACVSSMKVDQSINEIEFDSPGHVSALLSNLNNMRLKGQLVDVRIKTESVVFQAHRSVLASCSDYFLAMFTDPMRERWQTEICLAGVSSASFHVILEWIYTSKLALSLANIQDVLASAAHLQVPRIVEACANYLQAQLDLDNCVDVVTIAETYSLQRLRSRVYHFMAQNLTSFSRKTEFQRLSAAQMEHLLSGDFPVDVSEESVLEILLLWLDFQSSSRMAHAHRLLRQLNFEEMHPSRLGAIIEQQRGSSLPASFLTRVSKMAESDADSTQSYCSSARLVNSRGMQEVLVKVGGFVPNGVTNQISYFMPESGVWRHLTAIPHVESSNFGCAVVHNDLFIVGGCFNQSLQEEHIHPFGFRFSPRHNKWRKMTPMAKERCRFSLTVFGAKFLYAIGGCFEAAFDQGDPDNEGVDHAELERGSCERYDCESDTWTSVSPLPGGQRSQHGAIRHQNLILVAGGLDQHDVVLNTILVYHPLADSWESEARTMPTPRADHVMLLWRDRIIFCGGWFEDEVSGRRVLVDTVDMYDVSRDTWQVVTRVPTPRFHSGIAIVNDVLYVAGGCHSDSLFDRASGLIESYDLCAGAWCSPHSYPHEVWEHACVAMHVPKGREDVEILPQTKS